MPLNVPLIISVGDLNKNKNNQVVIEAIKELPEIHYILCGNGPLKDKLKKDAVEIRDRVHFLGYRTDIEELMASSDIFVMSSLREGLSRSIMEAMATELPCVASKIRGNTDLITCNDLLCKVTSVDEFSSAISRLSSDNELRKTVGEANSKYVQEFSIEKVVNRMKEIYKSC